MKKKIFVIMPFDPELDEVYQYLKNIIDGECFEVFRADDLVHQQNILKDIVISIYESDLIIADLTGLNPNVFYELGLAHAFKKNVILLAQDINELPFDLRSYRVLLYSTHFSKIKNLQEQIIRILDLVKENSCPFGNPVTDWLKDSNVINNVINKEMITSDQEIIKNQDTEENNEIVEEYGFLDYLAGIDESMMNLENIVNGYTDKLKVMTEEINQKGIEIEEAWKRPSSGTASHVRKLTRKAAEAINDYATFVAKQNKKYEKQWRIFEDSISGLMTSPIIGMDEENLTEFLTFLNSINKIKEGIFSAKQGIEKMIESAVGIKGTESSITRAITLMERENKIFIGLLDLSISTVNRVFQVGQERAEIYKNN